MAAPTQYYVDPVSGSDAADGSIGTPWKTLKYAIETGITRDPSNGDQVNVKDSGADVYSSGDPAIDLQQYAATATAAVPLIIRGYTSAADDGGRGAITCTGRHLFDDAAFDHLKLYDLDITGGDSVGIVTLDTNCHVVNCTITQTSTGSNYKSSGVGAYLIGSSFIGAGTATYILNLTGSDGYVLGCYFREVTNVCWGVQGPRIFIGNIVHINATSGSAGYGMASANALVVANNTFINAGAGTIAAINAYYYIANNYVEGWSGTGGKAFATQTDSPGVAIGNRWYNCQTTPTYNDAGYYEDNSSIGSSGVTNAAGYNYTPTADLKDLGYPAKLPILTGTETEYNIGAIMSAATGGLMGHPGMLGRMNG